MKLNSSYVGNVDSTFLINVFKEGFNLLRKYESVLDSATEYIENPSTYNTDEGIIFLDIVGELLDLDISNLDAFYIDSISGYQDLKRRLCDCFEYYYKIRDLVIDDYEAFLPIELDNLVELVRLIKNSYGHLALFLVRQYEIDSLTLDNYNDTVEFSLENACKDLGIVPPFNVILLKDALMDKVKLYKPRIEIFDEYPELEDKFFNKVGEEFYDLYYLTYDDVIGVIEDRIDPESLKRKLNEASKSIQESADK